MNANGTKAKKTPRILVVGDVILDRYLHGRFTRKNPESNGRIFLVEREENRLGGAAAVAWIAKGFGADVTLWGMIGNDEAGKILQETCRREGIDFRPAIVDSYKTPVKDRQIEDGTMLPDRIDREPPTPQFSHDGNLDTFRVLEGEEALRSDNGDCIFDAILVADYAKGSVTQRLLKRLPSWGCPIIVDPGRGVPWNTYPAAAIIKANEQEAAEAIAVTLHTRIVITHGNSGIELLQKTIGKVEAIHELGLHRLVSYGKDNIRKIPGIPVAVKDTCGAGDTVLAAIGYMLALGYSLQAACKAANRAGAAQVQQLGVGQVDRDSLFKPIRFDRITPAKETPMTLGIDFDGTITAAPAFWHQVLEMAIAAGHRPVVVSCRSANYENGMVITRWLGSLAPKVQTKEMRVIFTNHESKIEAVKQAGLSIDVWIDDSPEAILHGEPNHANYHGERTAGVSGLQGAVV